MYYQGKPYKGNLTSLQAHYSNDLSFNVGDREYHSTYIYWPWAMRDYSG